MSPRPITLEDLLVLKSVGDVQLSPDGTTVAFVMWEPEAREDRFGQRIWTVSVEGGELRQLTEGPFDGSPRWSPDGRWLAFQSRQDDDAGPQIWVVTEEGGPPRRVTSEESGVFEFSWAPDGERIAYTALPAVRDETHPLVFGSLQVKEDGAGWRRGRRHLFVTSLLPGPVHRLTEGDFDVTGPAWSPDGTLIAFVSSMHESRNIDHASHVFSIEAVGGTPRRLTSGSGTASCPVWAPDGSRVVFVGQKVLASYAPNRLLAVGSEGGDVVDLLGDYDLNILVGGASAPGPAPHIAREPDLIVFCAREGGAVFAFGSPLAGGTPRKLAGGPDRVIVSASATRGDRLAYTATTSTRPVDVFVASLAGDDEKQLTDVNQDLLQDLEVLPMMQRTFTAPDGTSIEGWVTSKATEEPAPLLVEIHGGPHSGFGPAFAGIYQPQGAYLYHQVLATRGWTVLLLNPRGSDGYGRDFLAAIREGWGEKDMADFMAAVDTLVAEGTADPRRLAVCGYSYGGYMTNWIVSHSDRFAAAVSGGCVSNLASFYGTSDVGPDLFDSEMGGDVDATGETYRRLSPITHASNVTTPILLMHGERDERCPVGQAEEWFVLLTRLAKSVELVIYRGASHEFIISGRPSHRLDFGRRLVDWVARHCQRGRDIEKSNDEAPGTQEP